VRSAPSCLVSASIGAFLAASMSVNAAILSFSTSAPSAGAASISNWTGATFDADNVGGSGVNASGTPNNGPANDATTYVAGDRPAQGQTFTTGSNAGGYTLSAVTVRLPGYTNNVATGSAIGGYDLNDTSTILRLRVGRLSGSTFIPLSQETAAAGGSGNPGQGGTANGPGTYLTFTLKAPIVLSPNTTYAFDIGTNARYFELLGIRDAATGGNPYSGGTAYTSGANGVATGTIATQAGERVFQVDLTNYTPPAAGTFVHPGLLNTEADFERMRTNVALGVDPWLTSYNALTASWMGQQSGGWASHAQATITRGATNDTSRLYNDIAVVYGCALRWKISGDTAYADQAVTLLNSWAYTLTNIAGDTNALLTELYAYQFAAAAEIMRTYPGWQAADIAQFKTMIYNVFYPMAHSFLTGHNGTSNDHYWANWDLCALNSIYAIGVLCDDTSLTSEALNYFYSGIGNGCIDRTVNFIHPGHFGQGQEIGRDQGHASLNVAELATLCQMAWNQGVDLFGYENNRVLSLAEYTAKYNLFQDVPFTPYAEETWLMTGPSDASRGNTARPGWATLYHHYVNRKGLSAPYTKTLVDQNGPNWSYNGDSPGWDALTAAQPPIASGANPSGLTATVMATQPVLSWWGSAYATSYNVKRATTSGGTYTTIATGLTTNTYTDTTAVTGNTYYYVVTAVTPTGETGNSNEASTPVGTSLLARLKLDETSGTTAADSTGNGWTGTLVNAPTWTTGTLGNAVNLSKASSQYVSLPSGVVSTLSDFSISTWVYQSSVATQARIFDFGSGDGMYGGVDTWGNSKWLSERYMYLTSKSAGGKLRFAITRSQNYGETGVDGSSALPTGQWSHVTITKSGSVANLYVNGQLAGQNASMPIMPLQLPPTAQNYIGKSQWRGDPYFDGKIDDFRIYRGALSPADVQGMANYSVAHLKFDESTGTAAADSTSNGWNGTLVNSPTWTTGQNGNAVNLASASSQYATLPTGVVNGLTSITISSWVNLSTVSNWQRIFDFGTGTTNYMFLTPKNSSNGKVRFAIRTASVAEKIIDGTAAIPTGGWHHVAVTITGTTGTLYVDGVQVGQNTAMSLNPASLGATTLNYIGKSQFSGDPYLNGKVDDFRIFGTALTSGQIATLYGGLAAPSITVAAGNAQNVISWSAVTNATSYILKRSTTAGGPYTVVAGGLTGTSYTDTGLTNGTTYYYVLVAASSLAESGNATEASAMPVPPAPSAPTGLAGNGWNGAVNLSWTASATATSYTVKRSTTSGSSYAAVGSGVTTTSYTDTTATEGTTYYYVVSASNLGGESANSSEIAITYTQPTAYLKFDETTGTSAADASGNSWTGTLVNGPLWSAGRSNNTVDLDGADDYVSLPSSVVSTLTTGTFMAWVNMDASSSWARVFDFGTGTSNYMFLTPKNGGDSTVRFAIRTASVAEQQITGTATLPYGWHHVAVTLNGATGTLYVDGVQVGQNTAMTLNPSSLGATTLNYIGKSQFSGDPYLAGRVDEFRIYGRAMSATEIASIYANSPAGLMAAPSGVTATAGTAQAVISWTAATNATGYDVLRATTSGGPYTVVSTNQTAVTFTDTGLTTGVTYYYVVVARSSASESPDSAEVSATAQ
jgi:fibronectin type 3 domain-containing protein